MANAKKQSKTKSKAVKSSSKSSTRAKAASKSTRGSSRIQMNAAGEESLAQASYQKAKSFIDQNANLPTAGLALAGAGILALVSTQKGRSLLKAGAEAVISLVNVQAMTDAVTEVLPQSMKSSLKSEKPVTSKTDFAAASKRASGKQAQKSSKAQI